MMLTKSQLSRITEIQQYQLREGIELKEFRVEQISPKTVSVYVVAGRVGDENTAAQIFCLTGSFFIGPRGGVKATFRPQWAPVRRWKRHPIIYGWI